ncbi:MAG: serine/threonine protein kinase, partial [Candidatus Riflebacteria bacterium]|nr:serine/threonine protein kinase [Candidatus Riflebacteria bacterium]
MNTDIPKELEEKYEIKEKIGEGGMGRVFKVRHRALQRFDVCKVIQSRIFLNDDQKKKFIREARISSNLKKHKNIVQVYGAGGEDETPFILFEYVKGTTLESRIKEAVRLPTKEALFYAKEICEGLSYAHSMGIVHRDMKSENVILSDQIEDGFPVPKIADFGIATVKGEPPKQQKSEWSLHGTPSYMSPEQAAGEEATEQSDIYSVGIIMYEMLTGAVPFKGQSLHQVIMQHINEPPKPIHEVNPEVPIQVSELVHKAIEKKAGDRYASAEEFAGRLEKAMSLADRWLKGGGSKGAATTSSMRRATTSFSSF